VTVARALLLAAVVLVAVAAPPPAGVSAAPISRAFAASDVEKASAAKATKTRRRGPKKALWGFPRRGVRSNFPAFADLGVRYWQTYLSWAAIARERPQRPEDPNDPAYQWPAELDWSVRQAARHRIRVALMVWETPSWANGGRDKRWAPDDPRDYEQFLVAASRRYPSVRHWMIWGEPARNMLPGAYDSRVGPQAYARLLDAAYGGLKRVSRRNVVIGGMSYTVMPVAPVDWAHWMRLPDGRRPRLDMWGHNPYEFRSPGRNKPLLAPRARGFSDLDRFVAELDRAFPGKRLKLWLSEYGVQSDHDSHYFDFHVSQREQARWVRRAYRIVRRFSRVAVLGWWRFEDEPPNARRDHQRSGLVTWTGRRKPAYHAYRKAR
jgi:hypothetical protein